MVAGLILAVPAAAQFWTKNTFDKWSAADCRKLLTDSPWARTHTIGRVFIQDMNEPAAVDGRDRTPQITYAVRLLSAPPVRQAIVQLTRLDPRYAELAAEQKTEIDTRHSKLLKDPFTDRIVVQVQFTTPTLAYQRQLVNYWQAQSEEKLKQEINLISRRGNFPPARVIVGATGGDMQVIFQRVVDGQPMVSAGDRNFSIEFVHPTIGVLGGERVLVEFRVRNMMVNNELLY